MSKISLKNILKKTFKKKNNTKVKKKAIKKILNNPKEILDIATGTADFAISAAKHTQANITGIDISDQMIYVGNKKIQQKKSNFA